MIWRSKIDGVVRVLVEVKSAGTTLRDRHIEQAERYASVDDIRWVLLTNGLAWNLYHLTFEDGIEYERAFAVDLASDPLDRAGQCLALLHRHAIRKDEHEEYWNHRKALSAASIAKALFTEEVLRLVRREIRRRDGLLVDEEDLVAAFHDLFSPAAREAIGPIRIRRRPKAARRTPKAEPAITARKFLGGRIWSRPDGLAL